MSISVAHLLSTPRYRHTVGGEPVWWSARLNWSAEEKGVLRALCEANAPIGKSADGLGRPPTSLAWKAREIGLALPADWSAIIRPKPKPRLVRDVRRRLSYPFIIKRRDEHADLLAVNALVPRGAPGREDVCQEIMLALWEGKVTLDDLRRHRGSIRSFVRSFNVANFEAAGYAISLDRPLRNGGSWYDILAATPETPQ